MEHELNSFLSLTDSMVFIFYFLLSLHNETNGVYTELSSSILSSFQRSGGYSGGGGRPQARSPVCLAEMQTDVRNLMKP